MSDKTTGVIFDRDGFNRVKHATQLVENEWIGHNSDLTQADYVPSIVVKPFPFKIYQCNTGSIATSGSLSGSFVTDISASMRNVRVHRGSYFSVFSNNDDLSATPADFTIAENITGINPTIIYVEAQVSDAGTITTCSFMTGSASDVSVFTCGQGVTANYLNTTLLRSPIGWITTQNSSGSASLSINQIMNNDFGTSSFLQTACNTPHSAYLNFSGSTSGSGSVNNYNVGFRSGGWRGYGSLFIATDTSSVAIPITTLSSGSQVIYCSSSFDVWGQPTASLAQYSSSLPVNPLPDPTGVPIRAQYILMSNIGLVTMNNPAFGTFTGSWQAPTISDTMNFNIGTLQNISNFTPAVTGWTMTAEVILTHL